MGEGWGAARARGRDPYAENVEAERTNAHTERRARTDWSAPAD